MKMNFHNKRKPNKCDPETVFFFLITFEALVVTNQTEMMTNLLLLSTFKELIVRFWVFMCTNSIIQIRKLFILVEIIWVMLSIYLLSSVCLH